MHRTARAPGTGALSGAVERAPSAGVRLPVNGRSLIRHRSNRGGDVTGLYASRRTFIGSIRVARRAGSQQATRPTATSTGAAAGVGIGVARDLFGSAELLHLLFPAVVEDAVIGLDVGVEHRIQTG